MIDINSVPAMQVHGLTKKYNKFTLGPIDFSIPKGFTTALIGANGAGKTTMIDILGGVFKPNDGGATYFDENMIIDKAETRERIGYCSATDFFPLTWNIKNIAMVMEESWDSFDRKKFESYCTKFKIETEHDKKLTKLQKMSDGNKMRTCLAALFARDCDLLIMDEPGSSLDPSFRDKLCDEFRAFLLRQEGEKTIFFSTHNIADMENVTDYAVFMDDGKVIEKGFVDVLKDKYCSVRGNGTDWETVSKVLISGTNRHDCFCGLAIKSELEAFNAMHMIKLAVEEPSLQELSVGLLEKNEFNK